MGLRGSCALMRAFRLEAVSDNLSARIVDLMNDGSRKL
jgi:hypothetical protein